MFADDHTVGNKTNIMTITTDLSQQQITSILITYANNIATQHILTY